MNDGPEEALRRCEQRLRQAEERLHLMEESVKDYAILYTDADGVVTFWSKGAERVFGYAESEIIGGSADVLFTPEDREAGVPRRELGRAEATGHGEDVRWHTRKDGTLIFLNGVVTPLRDEEGGLRGFAKVARDVSERRRAEEQLRESEERLRMALTAARMVAWQWNPADGSLHVSENAADVFGLPQGTSLVGIDQGVALLHPDDVEQYRETFTRAIEQRGSYLTLYRLIRPDDGRVLWMEERGHAVCDESGGVTKLAGVVMDITEAKHAEEGLRQARDMLDATLSVGEIGTWEYDVARNFVTADRNLSRIYGVTPEGPMEGPVGLFTDIIHPDDRDRVLEAVGRALESDGVYEAEYRLVMPDRSTRWVIARARGVRTGPGGDLRMPGVVVDITGQKRVEEALRETRSRLESTLAAGEVGTWEFDPVADVVFADPNLARMFGVTPEEAAGGPIGAYLRAVHPDDRDRVAGTIGRSIETGEGYEADYRLIGADASVRWVVARGRVERDGSGRALRLPGVVIDVTGQRRAEEALRAAKDDAERANRAKDHFLAVLSHELRTPLNPILLAASSMLERTPDPEDVRPTLEMIRQNVKLQARLIDDLLDVMRIVQGKMPLHWGVSDCHALIEQSIQICRSEFQGKSQEIVLDLAAERHHVNADSARLHQVLWNLVRNAVKFTPEGGTIAVRTRNEGSEDRNIVIEVADTGIGIEPGALPAIFDPFQQGETTITRRFGGLGLGLAICKGIVDAHGGTLEAESEGSGRGTTFRVALRTMAEPGIDAEGASGEFRSLPPLTRLNILLVEDEAATLRLMARLLKGLGHRVTAAATVAAAWDAFRAGDFDMIVSDIGLPDGTGLDLMRKVKAMRRVPAIALTGYGMDEDVRRSREAGFTTHMTKPIDFTKLEAMIRQVAN